MRISIVTPSYQQASYLGECLGSVRDQRGVEVEHIVMDGGSTDGSVEVLERSASQLAHWESVPDRGQSHAINKGLARSTGEVFNWVNSDDALVPDALAMVARAFAEDPRLLVFGGRQFRRQDDQLVPFAPLNDASRPRQLFIDPVVNQPATFFRTDIIKAIGGVDEALRYVMDVELWWQVLFRHGTEHLRFVPDELAIFRLHGESKTVSEHAGFVHELALLLLGMCRRTGLADLASVLLLGHAEDRVLRGVPVGPEHRDLVRDMTVHFLLKWHGHVHDRREFRMMRALLRSGALERTGWLTDRIAARADGLRSKVGVPCWTIHRLRRKWRHLVR